MKRLICIVILVLAAASPLAAELETTVELSSLLTVTRDAAGKPIFSLLATGDLLFEATNNANVKGALELSGAWSGDFITDPNDIVKRLYVKINFGGVYLLAGKTRVSFGEGFVFNAGDVIFGSMAPVADISSALLRDNTDWLVDLTLPLGPFSFFEAILLPYSPLSTVPLPYSTMYDLRGGGRFVFDLAGLKLETGYLFRADNATHNPYISLQGNLFFDFQVSSTVAIPSSDYTDEKLQDGFAISAGLFRMFQFDDGSSLTFRFEGACHPFAHWDVDAAPLPGQPIALLLYPEIAWAPLDVLSFQLRAMISPVDGSGMVFFGTTFGIYQGLDLIGNIWCMFGDSDDLFKFDSYGDLGIALGLQFIY